MVLRMEIDDDFGDIIHVALGVYPAGEGQADQLVGSRLFAAVRLSAEHH